MVLLGQSQLNLVEPKQGQRSGGFKQSSLSLFFNLRNTRETLSFPCVCSPVISLLQKLLQALKFTHLQVRFIRVLVTDERTAVGEEERPMSETVEECVAHIDRQIVCSSIICKKLKCVFFGFFKDSPIFGVWTLDVLALFEVSLQVHGEQRGAGRVVGAADRPVVTTGLVFSAEKVNI